MKDRSLFATCAEADFFDRSAQIEGLVARALGAGMGAPSVLLTGRRWVGKTEILRRVHRRLFFDQAAVVPVYYRFRPGLSASDFALTFLKDVLTQVLAFNRRESAVVRTGLSVSRLEAMLSDDDSLAGCAALLRRHAELVGSEDGREVVRNGLRVGAEASGEGLLPLFFIFDDIDVALGGSIDASFDEELSEAIAELDLPVIASSGVGSRGNKADVVWGAGPVEAVELKGLGEEDAVDMLASLCMRHNVEYDTDVLVQLARKLGGNPLYIRSLVWAAHRRGLDLSTLRGYADLYAGELIDGSIGALLKSSLSIDDRTALKVLNWSATAQAAFGVEELSMELSIPVEEAGASASRLSGTGLIGSGLGTFSWTGDKVMADFVRYTHAISLGGSTVEEVKTVFVSEALRGGYIGLGSNPAGGFDDEVRGVLSDFKGGETPAVLFDNATFALRYNIDEADISGNGGESRVIIPEVVGVFDTSGWESREAGPPIIVARGFQCNRFDAGNEVVWLVFVKEGVGPVNQGDVDNFLRRSAILRHRFRGVRIVRWVVGYDEFTAEALGRLDSEGVYSSDNMQLGILKETLAERPSGQGAPGSKTELSGHGSDEAGLPGTIKEFEVVLPKSSKAELVAVKAAEEIGVEMGFDHDAIGQIKAALVEGCINAFEHSRSRSGRVHMRFVARADRLIIYIQNGGVGFDGKVDKLSPVTQSSGLPRKRGWGIELMKGLMDEVRFERLHDGTKIVLVKYLAKEPVEEEDEQE